MVLGLAVSFLYNVLFRSVANFVAVETTSADGFPFVGAAPRHPGQWITACFAGHGK